MGKVFFDISISLDGYMTGANRTPEEPMGDGGERLTEWAFAEENQKYVQDALAELGAVICGRVTYDTSLPWWGADGPTGAGRRPVFVVTHEAPEQQPENGVYEFVTDGVESALRKAQVVAGEKDVTVMGGASIGQQFIAAGLVDELSLHVVPVVLGSGTPMFDRLHGAELHLEPAGVTESGGAVHMRLRVADQR